MGHISELALFDYLAGKADLTAQGLEHLQDCDDCRNEGAEIQRLIEDSGDLEKTRRFLADEETFSLGPEFLAETHEAQRELEEG